VDHGQDSPRLKLQRRVIRGDGLFEVLAVQVIVAQIVVGGPLIRAGENRGEVLLVCGCNGFLVFIIQWEVPVSRKGRSGPNANQAVVISSRFYKGLNGFYRWDALKGCGCR